MDAPTHPAPDHSFKIPLWDCQTISKEGPETIELFAGIPLLRIRREILGIRRDPMRLHILAGGEELGETEGIKINPYPLVTVLPKIKDKGVHVSC